MEVTPVSAVLSLELDVMKRNIPETMKCRHYYVLCMASYTQESGLVYLQRNRQCACVLVFQVCVSQLKSETQNSN